MIPFIGGYLAGARTKSRAAGMAASARTFSSDIQAMGADEERMERLVLVVEAMWEILKREGYTDEDLDAQISAVVERREAGRAALKGQTCPSCQARIAGGQDHCQICGYQVEVEADPLGNL